MRELFDEVYGQSNLDPAEAVRKSTRTVQRKRFYTRVASVAAPEGFAITLDEKPVRTPSRKTLTAPVQSLAEMLVAEWSAQAEFIDPMSMPLTRLANSVIDGVVENAAVVAEDIVKFSGSDLLFYRAAHPAELVAREAAAWDPVLFWLADELGAHFIIAEGIIHVSQPEQAVNVVRAALPTEPWPVAALHLVTTITGSALLAVALWRGKLDADQVWAAAHVDDDWSVEHWGMDEEVAVRRASRKVDFMAAAEVIKVLRPSAQA